MLMVKNKSISLLWVSRGCKPRIGSPSHTNNALVPVFQKADKAIHGIAQLFLLILIRWIVTYPVDSVIQC